MSELGRGRGSAHGTIRPLSVLRRVWDWVPPFARRPVVRLMRSDHLRLGILNRLGIRPKTGFFTLSPGGVTAIDAAMDRIAATGIEGDYLEFGLYRGYTLWYAQKSAIRRGLDDMRFFGFDSFEGLPEVVGDDRKAGLFIPGDYRCTREDVEILLTQHDFDWQRAALVEGYYDQSLTPAVKHRYSLGAAALVMVDCDLYQSTVPVLAFLADLMQDGTIILFDDWDCFDRSDKRGERRAFREFLVAHPEWSTEPFMSFYPYGQGFIVRGPTPTAGPDEHRDAR